jgi:hypothetical protein
MPEPTGAYREVDAPHSYCTLCYGSVPASTCDGWQAAEFRAARQWKRDIDYCESHDEPRANCVEQHARGALGNVVVTPQQAEAYAEKILTAIEQSCDGNLENVSHALHDLVLSALRALHRAEEGLREAGQHSSLCGVLHTSHARRYTDARDDALDDLYRVGRLYGISETNAPGNPERTSGAIGERAPSGRPDTTRRAQPADPAQQTAHEQDRPSSASQGHSDGPAARARYSATPDSAERRTEPEETR